MMQGAIGRAMGALVLALALACPSLQAQMDSSGLAAFDDLRVGPGMDPATPPGWMPFLSAQRSKLISLLSSKLGNEFPLHLMVSAGEPASLELMQEDVVNLVVLAYQSNVLAPITAPAGDPGFGRGTPLGEDVGVPAAGPSSRRDGPAPSTRRASPAAFELDAVERNLDWTGSRAAERDPSLAGEWSERKAAEFLSLVASAKYWLLERERLLKHLRDGNP